MVQTVTPRQAVRRLGRFEQVVAVLVKYGFGEALRRIRVWECSHIERGILHRKCAVPGMAAPRSLRLALEELGPSFIKLGQVLSTRPDIIPTDFIAELRNLQASVYAIPTDVVRSIIRSELGRPVEELFDRFDAMPLAAASLAQVHRAVLKGEKVVLKVQRPGIVDTIRVDIDIVRSLAGVAERYAPELAQLSPSGLVKEFAEQIEGELDFRLELNNMRLFEANFADDPTVHIPRSYPELSTRRVITMEFLDGINISHTRELLDKGYDPQLIARRAAAASFKAVFEHGLFYADPHPGNIFVLPGTVIGLVDFGMVGTLSRRDRGRLARLAYFIATKDEVRASRALSQLMDSEDVVQSDVLESSMFALITRYSGRPARDMALAPMFYSMVKTITTRGGRFRPELLWLAKSVANQEDWSRSLGADFNVMEFARPFAQRAIGRNLSPRRQAVDVRNWLFDAYEFARDLPYDAALIVRQLKKGRIKIEFEHVGLDPMRRSLDRAATVLAYGLVIAALLVSSSVIVLARTPPLAGEVPILSVIGYAIAILLALLAAIRAFRR